jgi:hypothetical protein
MSTVSGTKLHPEIGRPELSGIPGLVHAFRLQADGAAEELPVDHAFDAAIGRGPAWYWLHLNLADARACAWLETVSDLPANAQKYVRRIEELLETEVILVSVGPDREQTVMLKNPFDRQ